MHATLVTFPYNRPLNWHVIFFTLSLDTQFLESY
jgi:hypothetical protein